MRNLVTVRNSLVVCGIVLVVFKALAAGFGLKPGLWETHVTKSVMDGKDMTAQMNGAVAQMQKAMANMPPEQRARMEAMMKEHGASMGSGGDGAFRLCITPEMANRDTLWVDPKGHCQAAKVNRSGNQATFEVNCASQGNTTVGKGISTMSGDSISSVVDMTVTRANGESHVMHSETEMKFVGADCGDVKPFIPPNSPPPK